MRTRLLAILTLVVVLPLGLLSEPHSARAALDPAMNRTWARTDYPVQEQRAVRTWMWGPNANYEKTEPYVESPGGQRFVAYFDKSRMEITHPEGDSNSIWYVTNGLLVVELITGRMQVGDSAFEQHLPADVNVAGDTDDRQGPTYATFSGLLNAAPLPDNAFITQRLDRSGNVTNDPSLAARNIRVVKRVTEPGLDHQIAGPFWDFMNSSGVVFEGGQFVSAKLFQDPYYATGYPITEPYWATVKVAGTVRDVLVQCFERRCLTYTPDNPAEWRVEMGNVGQHYHTWRYCGEEGEIVFGPTLADTQEWTSDDGYVHHYYDPSISSYVIEDRTPVAETDVLTWSTLWWTPSETLPKDYSLTVDILTMTNDTSDQSSAGLFWRVESPEGQLGERGMTELFANGLALSVFIGDTGTTRLTDPDEVPTFNSGNGAVNRLKIIVRGTEAEVYVNGGFVHAFEIDPRADPLANGFGFVVYRFYPADQPVTKYGFKNLYVRELKETGC